MTDLEASILNYHRADLIRKIATRWVTDAENASPDHVLEINTLDGLVRMVDELDKTYRFSRREDPKLPAFDHALLEVAVDEVTRELNEHLIPDYEAKVAAAMLEPENRERARRKLIASLKSIYGD